MECSELLAQYPESIKQELERMYAPWLRQGRTLHNCLTDQTVISEIYKQMKSFEKKTLESIIKQRGRLAFTDEELSRFGPEQMSGAEVKIGLLELRRKGIIATMKKLWGERVHVIARDVYLQWRQLFMPIREEDVSLPCSDEDIRIIDEGKRGLCEDVFQLVSYVERHEIILTQKGIWPKRHLQKLSALCQLKDEDLEGMPIRYAHQDAYSKAFVMLYDLALRLRLIRQEEGKLTVNLPSWEAWLKQDRSIVEQALYELWSGIYTTEEAWFQHAVAGIAEVGLNRWSSLEKVDHWLMEWASDISPMDKHERLTRLKSSWLRPLAALGWLQIGESANGDTAFRWRRIPETVTEIYVQEDFEVIAPPGTALHLRRQLDSFAILTEFEDVAHYQITKQSIWQACERNASAEQICQELKQYACYGLPENVEQAILQWGEQYGQISFADVRLLRCRDAKIADEIAAQEQLAAWIISRISDTDFIVRTSGHQELVRHLNNSGYAPRKTIMAMEDSSVTEGDKPRISSADMVEADKEMLGLVYPNVSIPLYEMDKQLPHLQEVYPQMDRIPSIWLRNLHSYHESTRKEMIRKAIEWQAYVRLRQADKDMMIIPRQLNEQRDRWSVIGFGNGEEMHCYSEEWEEMQLILPGINDTN